MTHDQVLKLVEELAVDYPDYVIKPSRTIDKGEIIISVFSKGRGSYAQISEAALETYIDDADFNASFKSLMPLLINRVKGA